MTSDLLLAYLLTATLLTMAPGLDTAMVLRSAVIDGPRHGAATSVGVAVGCLCWGSAAVLGLAGLVQGAPAAATVLRVSGAFYLGWAGAALILRPRTQMLLAGTEVPKSPLSMAAVRGFSTNILNPKVGIFYLTLLPQFTPLEGASVKIAWLLALIHVGIATLWFLLLSMLAGAVRPLLHSPRAILMIDRTTGGIFLLLGLGLIHAAVAA